MNDKLLHFSAGFLASTLGVAVWLASQTSIDALPWFACLAAGVAGLTKEAADWMDNRSRPGMHGVEFLDFAATLAGAVPVVTIAFLFKGA